MLAVVSNALQQRPLIYSLVKGRWVAV